MDITSVKELKLKPFRIQGMRAHHYGGDFETNKAYATFEEAEIAADSQACNTSNVKKGNRFIIYQAVAIVGPEPIVRPTETILLEQL